MSRRLRVLHVITRLDRGGSAENTLLTVAGLDPDRFALAVAVGPTVGERSPTQIEARTRGVAFLDVPHLVRAPHPLHDLLALRHLRRLTAEGDYDIVHTHTSKAGFLGRRAAHRVGTPAIVHTPHGHVFYGYYGAAITSLFVQAERRAARWCHRLLALTAADRDDHLRFGVGAPLQWEIIHSGVDFTRLDRAAKPAATLRAELGIDAAALVIGSLGRLTAVKGQADLLRAFAALLPSHPQARLVLIGDGEEAAALRQLAAELSVAEATIFTGWRTDVGEVLRALDIFALPSHNEGMGKALVEAMRVGLPVVATRVGGIPELIETGREGLLVPARDPDALAAALQHLSADAGLRRALGARAAARAADYSSERMVAKIADLYERLAYERGLTPATAVDAEDARGDGVAAIHT